MQDKEISKPNLWNINLPRKFRTHSKALDYDELKYCDVCIVLNDKIHWKRNEIVRTMCQVSSRKSRLIAIRKKDKPPDKVENLRTIQILPTDIRLLEQSTTKLR